MILQKFKDFPRIGRLIGVDWGARRTGVAVSDPAREFVFARDPILAMKNAPSIARQIVDVAVENGAVGIVMGLPLHADGTPSETTEAVRACAMEIASYTDLPICFVEENLTSVAASESLGRMRRDQVIKKLDSEAARIILENAIAMIKRAS